MFRPAACRHAHNLIDCVKLSVDALQSQAKSHTADIAEVKKGDPSISKQASGTYASGVSIANTRTVISEAAAIEPQDVHIQTLQLATVDAMAAEEGSAAAAVTAIRADSRVAAQEPLPQRSPLPQRHPPPPQKHGTLQSIARLHTPQQAEQRSWRQREMLGVRPQRNTPPAVDVMVAMSRLSVASLGRGYELFPGSGNDVGLQVRNTGTVQARCMGTGASKLDVLALTVATKESLLFAMLG